MKVFELMDELIEELETSPKALFSNKRSVDVDIVSEIVNDLKNAMPAELEEAAQILREKDAIIAAAHEEAASIVKSAEDELQARVSEDSVAQEAQARAQQMIAQAETNAKEITVGAKEYADDILAELEAYLADYLKLLRKNRLELSSKKKKD
jgi:cell division septum initiation protein DivIVA